jgi:hypothetical protein
MRRRRKSIFEELLTGAIRSLGPFALLLLPPLIAAWLIVSLVEAVFRALESRGSNNPLSSNSVGQTQSLPDAAGQEARDPEWCAACGTKHPIFVNQMTDDEWRRHLHAAFRWCERCNQWHRRHESWSASDPRCRLSS